MMRKIFLLAFTPLALAGCIGGKEAPDATLVADAPALVIPPNFELRPPRVDENGDVVTPEVNKEGEQARQQAQNILLGSDVSTEEISTPKVTEDTWLLEKAGAEDRNVSIRELMRREQQAESLKKKEEESKGWFSRNFGKNADGVDSVDAADLEEAELQ